MAQISVSPLLHCATLRTGCSVASHVSIRPTRLRISCAAAAAAEENNYQFRDDGRDVELRLRIPAGHPQVSAKTVAVDARDTSLSVALLSEKGISTLMNAEALYGRIKAPETVWYIDEDEIVIALKKLNAEQDWPGLLEAWEFLSIGVAKMLKATSVYIVGESTEINLAVAKELALGLSYVPMGTKSVMEELLKSPLDKLTDAEVADLEAQVLSSLSDRLRIVGATLGGKQGAAANQKHWRHLHSGITIWLRLSQAQNKDSAEAEAVKAKQEAVNPYAAADLVVTLGGWEEGAARPAAEGCLKALKYLIEADNELPGKKNMLVQEVIGQTLCLQDGIPTLPRLLEIEFRGREHLQI